VNVCSLDLLGLMVMWKGKDDGEEKGAVGESEE